MNEISISSIKSKLPTPSKELEKELYGARDFINAHQKTSNVLVGSKGYCDKKSMLSTVARIAYSLESHGIDSVYVGRFKTVYTIMLKKQLGLFGIEMKYFNVRGEV